MRLILALLLTLLATAAAAAEPWRAARWSMTPAMLDAAVPGLVALDPPWRYGGGLSAPRALRETTFAGLAMRALFQTGTDGRLAQILLERRRPVLRAGDGPSALAALRDRHGPEDRLCLDRARRGGPASAHALWRGATADIHLTWLDFGTGEGLDQIARAERDRLLREGEVAAARDLDRRRPPPGAVTGSLPRRLLIRFADPARRSAGPCAPLPPLRPADADRPRP